jgi:hypothetical protein
MPTPAEQMVEVLKQQAFLNQTASELKKLIEAQGYITEEQNADAEMYLALAIENENKLEELCDIAEGKTPIARCQHCKMPVKREAGLWLHSDKSDFFKCAKAGVPDDEYLAKWIAKGGDDANQ